MFKHYRKASQSPIPSWATNQQVLIIFFCAFRNKGEGAPAISDLVQRENNGTGYWIVNMSDSYFGRQQYVIYRSQLRATPSADCNISHIAVFLSSYLIRICSNLTDLKIPCKFLCHHQNHSKSYHAWYEEGARKGREVTWKVDTHVKGDDNENILRIIIIIITNYYSMNILPGSTNSIGWQLSFLVKNAENNVYGNNAATLYTNRANMIPPLRIPKAVCWQITHWGKRKACSKFTYKIQGTVYPKVSAIPV